MTVEQIAIARGTRVIHPRAVGLNGSGPIFLRQVYTFLANGHGTTGKPCPQPHLSRHPWRVGIRRSGSSRPLRGFGRRQT